MGRTICHLDGQFFEFSSNVDAPVTDLMDREDFIEFSTRLYGEMYRDDPGLEGLAARMKRAEERGHSRMLPDDHESLESFLISNIKEYTTYNEATEDFDVNWPGIEKFKLDFFGTQEEREAAEVVQLNDTLRDANN